MTITTNRRPGHFSVIDFGARADGTTDDSAAFATAIAAMGAGQTGKTLYVPPGTYRLASTLAVNKNIILRGEGSNNEGGFTTTLLFDQSVAGLIITGQAQIENITIAGPNTYNSWAGTANTHGIEVRCGGVILRGVFVKGFNGYGVYQNGTSFISDFFTWDSVHVQECGRSGFFLAGGDANAGVGYMLSAIDCGEWGLWDNSFLGNTWIACHTSSNNGGAYKCDQVTTNSTFLNCYSESGQPASVFGSGVIILGGNQGAGITTASTSMRLVHSGVAPGGQAVISSPVGAGGAIFEGLALGSIDPNTGASITLTTFGAQGSRLYFANKPPTGWSSLMGGSEWFSWNSLLNGTYGTSLATGGGAAIPGSAPHSPRAADPGQQLVNDIFMGGDSGNLGTGAIKMAARDSIPSSGQWQVGDVIWNAQADRSGGWRCISGGTFGTYSEGRTVSSSGGSTLIVSAPGTLVIRVGDRLLINGTTDVTVTNISNLTSGGATPITSLAVSSTVPSGSGLSIAYIAPTFKEFSLVPSYGELYENNDPTGTNITVTTAGTYYQWVSTTVGVTSGTGLVVGSAATDNLTIGVNGAGVYQLNVSGSITGSNNSSIHVAAHINGALSTILTATKVGTSGDVKALSGVGLVNLSAGDVLDLRFTSDGNGNTVNITHLHFTINRIG